MADVPMDIPPPRRGLRQGWLNRLVSGLAFQRWAARFALTRRHVRAEGEAIFDLVAGFAHSQVLRALIEFNVLELLRDDALHARNVAARLDLPEDRADTLLRAGVALGLLRLRGERFQTSIRGAALMGVPGLSQMIRHHDILYRDLSDPVAFFRDETDTELARFWPYVFGGGTSASPTEAARYSRLMADSQGLVAQDTLAQIDLRGIDRLMDVGGGTGVFLSHVAAAAPSVDLTLFDLPQVMPAARDALAEAGLADQIALVAGSFKTDPLPRGADAVSLIRVLYDHDDAQVAQLLTKCFDALPEGGRLIISEPMTGGAAPHRAGDVYFALYCMAMRTGRARSRERIAELARAAGFTQLATPRAHRPFVTSTVLATRP